MMNSDKKIEEGLEHIKLAEKYLKTSLLKWRPDFDEAADEYNKAATCFRVAKSFKQCKECLLKAADCHKQNRHGFYAAKSLDQAILVSKELGDFRDVVPLARRAADLFQSSGNGESAASTLDKAAKILESQHPDQALPLFQQAADISIAQDNGRQAAEYMSKVARLHVKLQQYDLAADAIRREMGLYQENDAFQAMGRLAVALVLVQLARGDVVAAEKAFKEWGNCCDAPEIQTLECLMAAYDDEDAEGARRALADPFIRHMDVEYALLARNMELPESMAQPVATNKPPTIRENAAPSYISPMNQTTATIEGSDASGDAGGIKSGGVPSTAQGEAEEEEEGLGLC